jgi:hypothetical protein
MNCESWKPFLIPFLASLGTLLGTLLTAYLQHRWTLKGALELDKKDIQRKTFSQLMGIKFMTTQLYMSRFEALIFSDYHEARWKIAGYPKESIDYQEAQRWMRKSEDFVMEIAKNNNKLFELIGTISVIFPHKKKLEKNIERLYRFKTPTILREPPLKIDELSSWKTTAVSELQEIVEREYAQPIDEVLRELRGHLESVTRRICRIFHPEDSAYLL